MIPELYSANETDFSTTGIFLNDTISCVVTEERNGSFELKMVISKDDVNYSELETDKIILAKPNESDDPQPFRIYRITKPLNGKVTVYGEHIVNRLIHVPVGIFSAANKTAQEALNALKSNALVSCPFTFESNITTKTNYAVTTPSALKSKLVGSTGSILQIYGGEYKYDKYKVSLLAERGEDSGVTLQYGENITNITQEQATSNVYTGICPYWKGQDAGGQDVVVTLPTSSPIVYASDHANFPYERILTMDFSQKIDHVPTETELRAAAEAYITNNKISEPNATFDVSFVPVWQAVGEEQLKEVSSVSLCDTVNIYYPSLGISEKAKVVKTEYNVLTERYNKITIGTTKTSFTERLASDISAASSSGGSGSTGGGGWNEYWKLDGSKIIGKLNSGGTTGNYELGFWASKSTSDDSGWAVSLTDRDGNSNMVLRNGGRLETNYLTVKKIGNGTGSTMVVDANGGVYKTSSSKRFKEDLGEISEAEAEKLYELPVVKFKYKDGYLERTDESFDKTLYGFFAEDVAELFSDGGVHDADGCIENYQDRSIIARLVKLVQMQHEEIEQLKHLIGGAT